MGYEAQNNATIERAFTRFRQLEYERVRTGMISVAQAGLLFLMDAHEMYNIQGEHHHLNEDNTLAWAVAYNGTIINSGDLQGAMGQGDVFDEIPGEAKEEAETVLKGTRGWVGIIYSSMMGWYRWDWEEAYLNYSREMVSADFDRIFRSVKT